MELWYRDIQVLSDRMRVVKGIAKVSDFVVDVINPILWAGLSPDVTKATEKAAFDLVLDLLVDVIFLSFRCCP